MRQLDEVTPREMIQKYRNVFGGKEGPQVLYHMLYMLGLFEETSLAPEDMALKNYAARLLKIISGSDVGPVAMEGFLKLLSSQQIPKGSEDS
jgi:hypothetical protein